MLSFVPLLHLVAMLSQVFGIEKGFYFSSDDLFGSKAEHGCHLLVDMGDFMIGINAQDSLIRGLHYSPVSLFAHKKRLFRFYARLKIDE